MIAAERRVLILEKIQKERTVVVSELAESYQVSEETIRRDLERLEEDGHITRGYGGAVLNETSRLDLPYNVRRGVNTEGKQRIASLALGLVPEGAHIFLDASTTSVYIARELKQRERLSVITNSLENLLELGQVTGWDVICTSGQLRPSTMSLYGRGTIQTVMNYHADIVFLSCKGMDRTRGITDGGDEIAEVKQAMIESSGQVVLCADHTKLDRIAFSQICGFDRIDCFITDEQPSVEWREYLEERQIRLICP